MIYIIISFLIVIVFTISFILWSFKSLVNLKWTKVSMSPFALVPTIIERAYHAVDFKAQTQYIMEKKFNTGMFRTIPFQPKESQYIIIDDAHKKHMIHNTVRNLIDEMITNGCVDIKDEEDRHNPYGPDGRILSVRIKVYKPDM